MNRTKQAFTVLILLTLCQCDQVRSVFQKQAAPKGPYAYTLHLDITPAAAARMTSQNYHLNVHAFYYGRAKIAKAPNADELNRLELGYELNPFPRDARFVSMSGEGIDTRLFPQIEGGQPYVLITVHAVNRSNFENEMLTCNNYISQIAEAQATPPVIRCHMQTEPD